MKSRETSFRLKRFAAEEKRRKVADLEHMIREFEHMATELDRQVQSEEDRTGIKDKSHFAYSTLAKAAAQRRDNLRASIANLRARTELDHSLSSIGSRAFTAKLFKPASRLAVRELSPMGHAVGRVCSELRGKMIQPPGGLVVLLTATLVRREGMGLFTSSRMR
jgi:hypothetical protein